MIDPGMPPRYPGWRDYEIERELLPSDDEEIRRHWERITRRITDGKPPVWPTTSTSSSSVPVSLPSPQIGENWWIEDAATRLLIRVKVIDVTPKTIEVSLYHPQPSLGMVRFTGGRYRKGSLTFVEKVHDAPSVESEPTQPTA